MNLTVILLGLLSSISAVHAVTITAGNGGGSLDYVRFPATPGIGSTSINGWLHSTPSTLVSFQSSTALQVDNGMASLIGDNDAGFQNLTFSLANGGTFTKSIVNPDASAAGMINFIIAYVGQAAGIHTGSFSLDAHGQNFFTIAAGQGEQITSVSFATPNNTFEDSGRVRIGVETPTPVPDGGATIALLGLGLAALGFGKRYPRL